ncbi:MAG TPA: ATP-binding protein [Streptosporangiaceae bacterium]|nr:ATP-binding protein [Streptosporangiaceae bacterium]
MTQPCSADELSTLFLFEKLTAEQLGWLCREGRTVSVDAGQLYAEGEPATCFYVLLEGTVVLLRRVGGDDIEVNRTDMRGAYGGAFFAYLGDRVPQVYNNSMRAVTPCRFFVLDAAKFAQLMHDWFPMAVHLLEGLFFGIKNTQEAIGQRERLLALGSLSAGLTHELNNPAAAAVRATRALSERAVGLRTGLAEIAAGPSDGEVLAVLLKLQGDAAERVAHAPELSALEASDREDEVGDWLQDHGVRDGWDLASAFVQAGLDTEWLDSAAAAIGAAGGADLAAPMRWLGNIVESELLRTEITDSVSRISALVGAARQYSQLDRAPYQVADVHELLDSTLVMLADKIGQVTVVKQYDRALPRIPCYPAELNQVWTNLIDNAIAAMAGSGTLTITTAADGDMLLAEIADTGPGIPAQIQERIFEPFFTTKPVGQGTGLGLDICWRIVVTRHHGDLRVQSAPGDTRFQVRLPVRADGGQDAG